MTPDSNTRSQPDQLQFDRAVDPARKSTSAGPAAMACGQCGQPITTEYFLVDGAPACAKCKANAERADHDAARRGKSAGAMLRATAYGLGASIVGAAIYYAVARFANLEWALIAILIGFMVGYAVRAGTGGRGGRRYQLIAAGLTYWSVGLAYAPLAFEEIMKKKAGADSAVVATSEEDSVAAAAAAAEAEARQAARDSAIVAAMEAGDTLVPVDAAADSVAAAKAGAAIGAGALVLGVGLVFVMIFALPLMVILGSGVGGIISALIIGFGMQQAWKMTAASGTFIEGPFKVGSETATAAPGAAGVAGAPAK